MIGWSIVIWIMPFTFLNRKIKINILHWGGNVLHWMASLNMLAIRIEISPTWENHSLGLTSLLSFGSIRNVSFGRKETTKTTSMVDWGGQNVRRLLSV